MSGQRRRIGLYGGSFDPPHAGHIEGPAAVREALGLERVIYLPTARPPHKQGPRYASALARYAMLELALLPHRELVVSDHELTPGRTAYTVDTVEHFGVSEPDADLFLLIGADSFAALDSWRRWRELTARVRLIVLRRPGWSHQRLRREAPPELLALLDGAPEKVMPDDAPEVGRALLFDHPGVDVSSTELRRQIAAGDHPPDGSLAPRVLDYIDKYNLYR